MVMVHTITKTGLRITPISFLFGNPNESLNAVGSFCSDDYLGILTPLDQISIAVGRLPVQSVQQAEEIVQKLIYYANNEEPYGSWRNEFCLVADDEDGNLHLDLAEDIAEMAEVSAKDFNLTKLYLDAFEQVTIGDSSFYPEVNEALTLKINQGVGILNYIGHGSYGGLAHERILTFEDMSNWSNFRFPVFVAATGDLARFDDPEIYLWQNNILLLPDKGMIAVISPGRLTYAGANAALQQNIYQVWFENPHKTLGEILFLAKIITSAQENTRKHILLGDPSMMPAIPPYRVVTESINGQFLPAVLDTLNPW